jgi:hypothetical protein
MANEAGLQLDFCEKILTVPDTFRSFRNSFNITAAFCVISIMTLHPGKELMDLTEIAFSKKLLTPNIADSIYEVCG